jgi:formylglycine-generating enzyme required for sulfatase activity
VPANGARAVVTAWAPNAAPDYMVFDLAVTSSQRVSYYPAEEFLPGGLLTNPDYRTTRLVMRKIPANGAVFTMGSVAEPSKQNNETIHTARLNNDYYMGVFEVTQAQWTLVKGENPSKFTTEGAMRPVECVSYQMIRTVFQSEDYANQVPENPCEGSFMAALRTLSGGMIDFDLPGEAEWEYACRAGNGEGYWGDGAVIEIDKYVPGRYLYNQEDGKNTTISMNGETPPANSASLTPANATAIVGSYNKNNFGLYDMHGNVAEWCIDQYKQDITGDDGTIILSGGTSRRHTMRGGSWTDKSGGTRSAYRLNVIYNKNLAMYGFRVKCTTGAK